MCWGSSSNSRVLVWNAQSPRLNSQHGRRLQDLSRLWDALQLCLVSGPLRESCIGACQSPFPRRWKGYGTHRGLWWLLHLRAALGVNRSPPLDCVYMKPSDLIQIQRTLRTAEQRNILSDALGSKLQLSGYQDNCHFKGTEAEAQ